MSVRQPDDLIDPVTGVNPPFANLSPKPMTMGELMEWHGNNGTLAAFLYMIGYYANYGRGS